MKQLQVTGREAKQRLDKYLKRYLPEMGTSFLYKMLRKKNITLNGKKATGSELLQEGDTIQCFFSDETYAKFSGNTGGENAVSNIGKTVVDGFVHSDQNNSITEYYKAYETLKGITVLYEDEHLLLLNKPAGILSQKAQKDDLSLNEWMLGYLLHNQKITESGLRLFKPSVCNRLDRNTSGLVICGKSLIGSREISRLLKNRTLQKYYRTYVHGRMEGEAVLTAYHKKDKKKNQAEILFEISQSKINEYDSIVTSYRTIESGKNVSYLEIELITGKTHQIRAHLAALGHPIVGDPKYGPGDKTNKHQLLHAYRVIFPDMEEELSYLSGKEFLCPEPDAFLIYKEKYFD